MTEEQIEEETNKILDFIKDGEMVSFFHGQTKYSLIYNDGLNQAEMLPHGWILIVIGHGKIAVSENIAYNIIKDKIVLAG